MRKWLVPTVIAALALLLSACGGGTGTTPDVYELSGTTVTETGDAIDGVTIHLESSGNPITTTTGGDGSWVQDNLRGTTTVTPQHAGYSFTPASATVTKSRSDVNFVGQPAGTTNPVPDPEPKYGLSGVVTDGDNDPVPGVTTRLESGGTTVTTRTDSNGTWTKGDLTGTTTVTAADPAYLFPPYAPSFTDTADDVDFRARLRECNSGSRTESDPCVITRVKQLQRIDKQLGDHYELGADIDASTTKDWNDGSGFKPLGSQSEPLSGSLDGAGHTVTGLWIDRPSDVRVGLVAELAPTGTISNLTIAGSTIRGRMYTAAVTGVNGGELRNIHTDADTTITGSEQAIGGLAGRNNGQITDSSNAAEVTGPRDSKRIGGITGENAIAHELSHVVNTGTVKGSEDVGGLVGFNNGGIIRDSRNEGAVDGNTPTGGVVGRDDAGRLSGISNSGRVNSLNYRSGGIAGINTENSLISGAQNDGPVTGNGQLGGIVGWNNGLIENAINEGPIESEGVSTGGIAGYNNGTINTAHNRGTMESDSRELGGIVGTNLGEITMSSNTGAVIGDNTRVGGLAGINGGSQPITSSFNTGDVKGESKVGGLVGENNAQLDNSYNMGTVAGTSSIGGIAGTNDHHKTIQYTFNTGHVGPGADRGAIVADGRNDGIVLYSHYDRSESGRQTADIGSGETTVDMQKEATYDTWDFAAIWSIDEGSDYPELRGNLRPE